MNLGLSLHFGLCAVHLSTEKGLESEWQKQFRVGWLFATREKT